MSPDYKPVGVGVAVIIRRDDKVLLVRRHHAHGDGTWSTPGGHIDFGEDIETCAARETLEETGVHIRDVRFLAVTNDHMPADDKHYVTIWMSAEHERGEAQVVAEYELSEVRWCAWDNLPSPLFIPFEHLVTGATLGLDPAQAARIGLAAAAAAQG